MLVKILKCFIAILFGLFAIVGGPIIINELYKAGGGYITMWGAEEVLSYYGSILASVIAVVALVITIIFTRKQIEREHFLKSEYDKWGKVESVIMKTLEIISPFNMLNISDSDNLDDLQSVHKSIVVLQKYSLNLRTTINEIRCYVSPIEYEKIEVLINEICKEISVFLDFNDKILQEFISLQESLINPPKYLSNYIIENRVKILNTDMLDITKLHKEDYLKLYDIKRDTFDKIYADIDKRAGQILKF